MEGIQSICVYCGSSIKVDDIYKQTAKKLGEILAEEKHRLVYGGGHLGLMGIIADAVMDNGGNVYGVITEHLSGLEQPHKGLSELVVVQTMHERKQLMVDQADAFVILPGGLGTMDEFFEVFTWWQLGLHDKPIVIVNINDYWTPLLTLIDNIVKNGFGAQNNRDYLCVVDKIEDVLEALAAAPREKIDPKTKWI